MLAVGLVVRESLSFWTGHPFDFELWVRTGYWVSRGVNPYGYLPPAPGLSFANVYGSISSPTLAYLPFWPLLLGAIYRLWSLVGGGDRFAYYLLLKQPAIIGDVVLGYAIYSYVSARRPESSGWTLSAWLLSPYLIIISGVWGMFDSLAALCAVAALMAPRAPMRSVWAGLAVLVKSIPVILVVPLALSRGRWTRDIAVALAIPALFTLAVVYAEGWSLTVAIGTLASTIHKGGASLSPFDAVFFLNLLGIIPASVQTIFPLLGYIWIPTVCAFTFLSYRWFGFETERGLVKSLTLITLSFMLSRAQVNEQYAVYLLALAAIDAAVWNPERRRYTVLITAVVLAYLLLNNPLLVRFAAPAFPSALAVDQRLGSSLGLYRYAGELVIALAFMAVNVTYAASLIRERRIPSRLRAPSAGAGTRRA